jgi:hypothetical protein
MATKRKRDKLPPVIKVPKRYKSDFDKPFPKQLADALDPLARDITDEVRCALQDALKALAEARGSIETVLKRMK